MSNKLTVYQQETIVKRVLEHRFAKAQAQLNSQTEALAEQAWLTIHTEADLAAVKRVPPGWLPKTSELRLKLGEAHHVVYFSPARVIPQCKRCTHVFDALHPLTTAYRAMRDAETELISAKRDAQLAIKAVFRQAATLPKLLKVWPEVEPFVYGLGVEPTNLPAVQTEQLNKLLDLPVTEGSK
jgi:hypothetical protein